MKTFTISKGGGRSVQELARATKCEVGGYANDFLNSSDLLAESDTQDAEVVLIQFEKDPTTDEVIKRFEQLGLSQPNPEDALLFAEKYPDEQIAGPIAFLHKPWITPGGGKSVFILRQYAGVRFLHMALAEPQNKWYSHIRFAGVKK